MNDKIKAALKTDDESEQTKEVSAVQAEPTEIEEDQRIEPKIMITNEELEAYFIIKNLLKDIVPMSDITYRDTVTYINILYKDNGRKWICRLVLKDNKKVLILSNADKSQEKFTLNNIYDLENYKDKFAEILNRYI